MLDKKKNALYKRFLRNRNDAMEKHYKICKNRLTSLLRFCERQFYSDLLEENKTNIKGTWRVINYLLNKKSANKSYPSEFITNGVTITGNKTIAEYFNTFVVNVGPTLARDILKCNEHLLHF